MKQITEQWLDLAKTDLTTCQKLVDDSFLSNIVAFHAQQTIEKCFKAIIEDQEQQVPRIHTLVRLYGIVLPIIGFELDHKLLQQADSIYTASRYPGDMGILPDGKPSKKTATELYEFAALVFEKTTAYFNSMNPK
ncbi:MAG TPA: hypothetical protein DCQ31_09705 [Bacteroidales bacterium]|nr:hypothetical protein [Bacteroidales bacterium]